MKKTSNVTNLFNSSDLNVTTKSLCDKMLTDMFVHAIVRIFQVPHLPIKIFLSVFVLSVTSLSSLIVIQSINDYFSYQVITTARTIYETPTLFPKITFCNANQLQTKFAYMQRNSISNLTSQNDLKRLGHNLSDILLSCRLSYETCSEYDFIWSYDQMYGNCYTYNSGLDSNGYKREVQLKYSILSGSMYGFKLELYVNFYEKLLAKDVQGLGLVFRIGNSSYLIDHGVDGILVRSGQRTDIVIHREFKSILPKPYSNCEIELDSSKSGVYLRIFINLFLEKNFGASYYVH